jgi:hypothetical protein
MANEGKPKSKPSAGVAAARRQMKKSNGQTFVSSDTKPLQKQPRAIIHITAPAARIITLEDSF